MRILHITWNSYGKTSIREEFKRRGYEEDTYELDRMENHYTNQRREQELIAIMSKKKYDFVFSFNYFPIVAIACNVCKVPYASWIYDSPLVALWHCSVVSPYNFIFTFDKTDFIELRERGFQTVYYMPLAADVERYDSYKMDREIEEVYSVPISFIGSTYTETQFNDYKKINKMERFYKGYVDGLVQAQKRIYGNVILEEMITPDVEEKLSEVFHMSLREDDEFTFRKYYGQVVLARCIAALERQEILDMLSRKYKCHLYTRGKTPSLPYITNRGMAGNTKESTFIFRCSKINLNITSRSIRTGIPLRVFEIMGSGGFLLTNYQEDMLEYFEPGIDFVYYDSYEDLMKKADYYLNHEEERQQIAKNGYEKIKNSHTYRHRLDAMMEIMNIR